MSSPPGVRDTTSTTTSGALPISQTKYDWLPPPCESKFGTTSTARNTFGQMAGLRLTAKMPTSLTAKYGRFSPGGPAHARYSGSTSGRRWYSWK